MRDTLLFRGPHDETPPANRKPTEAPGAPVRRGLSEEEYTSNRNIVIDWFEKTVEEITEEYQVIRGQLFQMVCEGEAPTNENEDKINTECARMLGIDKKDFKKHISISIVGDAVEIDSFYFFTDPDDQPLFKTRENNERIFEKIKSLSKKIILTDAAKNFDVPIRLYKYLHLKLSACDPTRVTSFFNDCSYYKQFGFEMELIDDDVANARDRLEEKLRDVPDNVITAFAEMKRIGIRDEFGRDLSGRVQLFLEPPTTETQPSTTKGNT